MITKLLTTQKISLVFREGEKRYGTWIGSNIAIMGIDEVHEEDAATFWQYLQLQTKFGGGSRRRMQHLVMMSDDEHGE